MHGDFAADKYVANKKNRGLRHDVPLSCLNDIRPNQNYIGPYPHHIVARVD